VEAAVGWIVIILVSVIAVSVWNQNRQSNNQKLGVDPRQIKRTSGFTYLGGLPDYPNSKRSVRLVVTPSEVALEHGSELFIRRSMSDVYEIIVETEDEATRRLTATRMLTLGVFALAVPKKKPGSVLVTIDCKQGPVLLEAERQSKTQLLMIMGPSLAIVKENSLGTRGQLSVEGPLVEAIPNASIADEIAKLGKLLADGVIDQAEFERAKARLLDGKS